MDTLYGMKVVISKHLDNRPNIQLNWNVQQILFPYNTKFVVEYNQWLKEFFGTKNEMYLVTDPYNPGSKNILVGPKGYAKIKQSLSELNKIK